MSRQRKMGLKRNILSNMSGQAILMVLCLVSTYLVFRKLGADMLSVIYFLVTVIFVLLFVLLVYAAVSFTVKKRLGIWIR